MRQVLLAAAITAITVPLYAQFLPDLQAKTPEEYDAYLDVMDGPVLEKGRAFEHAFPQSALLLPVYGLMARQWRSQGDAARATESARKALAIAPEYAPMLVELADLLANSPANLDEAQDAARRALVLLETVKAPQRVGADEWIAAVSALKARAHGALGLVLFKKDDVPGAIKEFEAALAGQGTREPALHYRLGRLYAITGRKAESRAHLQEAASRGDKVLRELANTALAELR